MALPTFDGQPLFGDAVKIQHIENAAEFQTNSFFGQAGVKTLAAGTRGRAFLVRGLLRATSIDMLNQFEAAISAYNDGRAYDLVDTRGRTWPQVQYRGGFKPDERGLGRDGQGKYTLAYELILHGLI